MPDAGRAVRLQIGGDEVGIAGRRLQSIARQRDVAGPWAVGVNLDGTARPAVTPLNQFGARIGSSEE
jgi:hypothetical protein